MTLVLPLLILMSAAILAGLRTARLVGRWRIGKPVGPGWIAGLAALPRRYLRDIHHVVAREKRTARMHAALAGGLLAGLGLTGLLTVWPARGLALLALGALGLAGYGLTLQALRRRPRPARLSAGAWARLTPALGAALCVVALAALERLLPPGPGSALPLTLSLSLALSLIGAAGLFWLASSIEGGPMRHAVAGSLHLARHPRPARFAAPEPAGHADSALLPIPLTDPRLGVGGVADLGWNRLAAFDACVQCGRCEAACPAFAAGLPLNPKALIADLSLAMAPQGAANPYAGSAHPGRPIAAAAPGPHAPIVIADGQGSVAPDTLWSCTTCRACVEECPMLIEHVDTVVDLRRFQTLELGALPAKAAEVLDHLRMTDTQGGHSPQDRLDGLVDLNLPLAGVGAGAAGKDRVDLLLWLGEAAYDRRNQRQIRAFVTLLRRAGVDFAVLPVEADTGDLARRLGDEAGFQRLARANIDTLSRLNFGRIVTMDPHVLHSLSREYPAMGGRWTVLHHSTLLAELLDQGRLRPRAGAMPDRLTLHDPCYLGRYNGGYDAPRRVLAALGADLVEMDRSASRSRCCGGGGGAPLADVAGERRIPDMRIGDARETGAALLVTACPFCTQMLEGVTGDRPDVADLAELLLAATEDAT